MLCLGRFLSVCWSGCAERRTPEFEDYDPAPPADRGRPGGVRAARRQPARQALNGERLYETVRVYERTVSATQCYMYATSVRCCIRQLLLITIRLLIACVGLFARFITLMVSATLYTSTAVQCMMRDDQV